MHTRAGIQAVLALSLASQMACLEQVTFVPKAPAEATLLIIRDGGNEDDEIKVFVDSLLVGTTYQNAVSVITVPAGKHYVIFEWDDEVEGGSVEFTAGDAHAVNQVVIDAYVYKQFNNKALKDEEAIDKLKNTGLAQHRFSYLGAKEKMNTEDFLDCVHSLESPFEIQPHGFRLRIRDTKEK